MLSIDLPLVLPRRYVSLGTAMVMVYATSGVATAAYTVKNVSNAVAGSGAATANSDFGSASLSTDGSMVAGFTSGGNPFVYKPATGAVTVLSSISAITVAVNNSGTAVGGNNSASSATPNFVYKNGVTTVVSAAAISGSASTPPGYVSLSGVNNSGIASGYLDYTPASFETTEGTIYNTTAGTGTNVGVGFSNQPATQFFGNKLVSINDSGVAAGFGPATNTDRPRVFYTATPNGSGYTYKDLSPALTPLSVTSSYSVAIGYVGIDSHGDVAGTFTPNTTRDGFLYDPTTNTAVDISAGVGGSTDVNGLAYVNGVATVVGVSSARFSSDVAFLFTKAGGYQTLSSYLGAAAAGYTLTSGLAISEKGDILAVGTNPSGVTGTFLFAVPEPASLTSVAAGMTVVLRRRRKST